jgi:hypothetical protein
MDVMSSGSVLDSSTTTFSAGNVPSLNAIWLSGTSAKDSSTLPHSILVSNNSI